jgi:hypothetical protein
MPSMETIKSDGTIFEIEGQSIFPVYGDDRMPTITKFVQYEASKGKWIPKYLESILIPGSTRTVLIDSKEVR